MASSATQISLFLLLTLLSSYTLARDSQYFSKLPSTTNTKVVPTDDDSKSQPDFVPDNENGYGLYGHESGQLTPSATTPQFTESEQPPRKYLPKNYNPVAYVTVPEDINDRVSFTNTGEKTYATNPSNYYNTAENFYNPQQEDEAAYKSFQATTNDDNKNGFYYNGGSSFNSEPQGFSDTRFDSRGNYFDNRGSSNGFQPQGMSDTRFLENGKYFYDVKSEKYSDSHPYESLRGVRPTNRGYFGNYGGYRQNNGEFP